MKETEENNEESESLREFMEINDTGDLEKGIRVNPEQLQKEGVENINDFLDGLRDGVNNSEFNNSTEDYIKGFKYGKTREYKKKGEV